MLILGSILLGSFVFYSLLSEDEDDDNGPDSGIMTPVFNN
jgi:hypothetical protein